MRDLKTDLEQIQNFRSKWRQSTSLEEAWGIGEAWEWEKKYRKLRSDIVFLEYELTPTVRDSDPEFLVGWNLAMGKAKSMIERVLKVSEESET